MSNALPAGAAKPPTREPPAQTKRHARRQQPETPEEARKIVRRHPLKGVDRPIQITNENGPDGRHSVRFVE